MMIPAVNPAVATRSCHARRAIPEFDKQNDHDLYWGELTVARSPQLWDMEGEPDEPSGGELVTSLLETTGLTIAFGGLRANDDISLTVDAGRLVGLIGPNGAGKTTFIDAITGFVKPTSGSVRFRGEDITRLPTHERAHRGMSRTWQSLELFEDLTVADNLLVAAERPRWYSFLADIVRPTRSNHLAARVDWALDQVGLRRVANAYPSDLSHGHRKLIGVARALVASPELLLLDEPAAGLDSAESHELGADLRRLLDVGITVFLVDHDMGLVLNICDYLYVLDFGRIIARGTPAEIRSNPDVVTAYLGQSAGDATARGEDPVLATARDLERGMGEE